MSWIICPHIENGSADAARYARALKAKGFTLPAVKLVNAAGLAGEYRDLARVIVGRQTITDPSISDAMQHSAHTLAQQFVLGTLAPHIRANPLVDAWEVWNEPVVNAPREMEWLAAYLVEGIRLLREMFGKKAVASNFSAGHAHHSLWPEFAPVLAELSKNGGYVGMHEYANRPARLGNGALNLPPMVGHVNAQTGEIDSLLGRQKDVNKHWRALGFPAVPVIITETGLDGTEPGAGPWKQSGYTKFEYAALMAYYSDWMRRECPNVMAATIFTNGFINAQWANHDIEGSGVLDELQLQAEARLAPAPTPVEEVPLFSYPHPGGSLMVYSAPDVNRPIGVRPYGPRKIEVWERVVMPVGQWWRILKKGLPPLWIRHGG